MGNIHDGPQKHTAIFEYQGGKWLISEAEGTLYSGPGFNYADNLKQEVQQAIQHRHQWELNVERDRIKDLQAMITSKTSENDAINQSVEDLQSELAIQQMNHKTEIDQIRIEHQQALNQIIVIACTCTGGLGIILVIIVCLVLRCKAKKKRRNQNVHCETAVEGVEVYVDHTVSRGKVQSRPPILVDKCNKYGMNEIDDVTAGEGADLVRIARPLETAGASRKLSEALLNIQPIYQDQEGQRSAELGGTANAASPEGDHERESDEMSITELCRTLGI